MADDTICRQQAIDEVLADVINRDRPPVEVKYWNMGLERASIILENLPSAQPTLYGYSIEHLALIARVMQKEHITPEKAIECFKDIQRMGQMIIDEQQEMIKRAVEKWTI